MSGKIRTTKDFLALLKGVKKTQYGYKALCPGHADHNQSLSIKEADMRVLIHCFAGCEPGHITAKIGLQLSDLSLNDNRCDSNLRKQRKRIPGNRKIVAAYRYTDANGRPFEVLRTDPKGFFQRQPIGKDGYVYDLKDIIPMLYRREDVEVAKILGEIIYVVEGEKDVERLRSLGLTATCNPGGAGKWNSRYSDTLRNIDVVIIPDTDSSGRKHAREVAASCYGKAKRIRILELQEGKDITDWLERGHNTEELQQLVDGCVDYEPPEETVTTNELTRCFNLTDMGNAERLVHKYGDILHYCYERKKWLIWTGKVWEWDVGAKIKALAKDTVRAIYQEAAEEIDESRRKNLASHAKRSESDNKVSAMISLAQSEKGISVCPNDLDKDPWLFNCLNGTIDLKTGQLLPHRKNNLLTTMVPIEFVSAAQCPLWLKFLDEISAGDIELQPYLQRAVGYSLTGQTTEQCFFFLYGLGSNGKSTFLETIRRMMGDYGDTIATETLMTRGRYTGGPQESLANLKGRRLAIASEVQEGRRLNIGLIKDLTGSDTIKADRKYEHEIEFSPTHKIWMRGNHKPVITETSLAMWRRVKLLPFTVTISSDQIDKQLQEKLQKELPGILAWAVRGCLEWQKVGLAEPSVVVGATEKYRAESDILNDFFEDSCILEPTAMVTKKELRATYKEWCEANNQEMVTQSTFKARLTERGITQDRIHGGVRIWRGVRKSIEGDRVTKVTGTSKNFPCEEIIKKTVKITSPLSPSKLWVTTFPRF